MIVVLTGPSGVGKSTIEQLLSSYPDTGRLISYTTRAPRENEKNGVDYYFIDNAAFRVLENKGLFAESATPHGRSYGVTHNEIETKCSTYKWVIFVADPHGAAQIKHQYKDTLLLFISPPSMEVLEQRINHRGDMDPADLKRRLEDAEDWIKNAAPFYDYIIVNDDLDLAVQTIRDIFSKLS